MVVIDMFSRKLWLESTSRKSGPKIAEALERILSRSDCKVERIQCDMDENFIIKHVFKVLKNRGIRYSPLKRI